MEDGGWLLAHLWLVLLLLAPARCICPSKCTCRDEALVASCVKAGLEFVPIQLNPDVQVIELRENRIGNVDYTLTFYSSLQKLDVSFNKIASLKSNNFEHQGKLVSLNASHNQISALGKDAFRGLKKLRILDLSHNNISVLDSGAFRDTIDLQSVDLSYNAITSFADPTIFKHISALRVLHLHHNEILDVPSVLIKNLPSPCLLETISLDFNLIEIVEDKAFPPPCSHSLTTVTLGSNVIKDIEKSAFNSLNNLTAIDLSFNNLTFIPTMQLSKLSRLRELDLSGNRFSEIRPVAFQSLFQLRVLTLSKLPHLERVDTRAFVDNIRLETLYMDENKFLTRLPSRLFHGNPQLMHVSLRGNSLTTTSASNFPLDKLRSLDLSGNPLHCNCSLDWLWKLVQMEVKNSEMNSPPRNESNDENSTQLRLIVRNLKCAEPEILRDKEMADIPESTVRCETTLMAVAVVSLLLIAVFVSACLGLLLFRDCKLCRRPGKQEADPCATDTRRLATGLRPANGPPPILMLMPDKHYRDAIMTGFNDTKVIEPWMNGGEQAAEDCAMVSRIGKPAPQIAYV